MKKMWVLSWKKGPTAAEVLASPNWLQCAVSVRSSVRGVWSSRFEISIAQRNCFMREPLGASADQLNRTTCRAGTSRLI